MDLAPGLKEEPWQIKNSNIQAVCVTNPFYPAY